MGRGGGGRGGAGGAAGAGGGGRGGAGAASGGAGSGGAVAGGRPGSGGSGSGGAASGGAASGGSASGGSASGGAGTGGAATGGAGSGGAATGGQGGACLDFDAPKVAGNVQTNLLEELSGMVASRAHPGVLYAHADAGAPARFIAMDTTGKTLGEFTLAAATATDWEDISLGRSPAGAGDFLFIGDIGDNAAREGTASPRAEIRVYRLPEPVVVVGQTAVVQTLSGAEALRFTYPDRPHDAETLMVDPLTADIVIITKENDGNSVVFRAPGATPPNTPTVLERITSVQFGIAGTDSAHVTSGDISPTGDRVVVRTYTTILLWPRITGATPAAGWVSTFAAAPRMFQQPVQAHGEAIAFASDGRSWFAAGEQETKIFQSAALCP